MSIRYSFSFYIILFLFPLKLLHGQCSDAGVCSIGGIQANNFLEKANQIGINYIFAYSTPDDEVTFHTIRLDGSFNVYGSTYLDVILPVYALQDGPEGSVGGIGDIIVLLNQPLFNYNSNSNLGISIGAKFATGDENTNQDLPQIYQPGLGTNDFLFGINYLYKNFEVSLGYQLVENIRNNNAQTRLKRGDDLFFKFGYTHHFDKLTLNGKLLAIKRLEKSSVLNTVNNRQNFYTVPDSDQLQINLDSSVLYQLNPTIGLTAQLVTALLSRDVNVDGLTRGITLSFGSAFLF